MDAKFAHSQSQRLLRQRNRLAIVSLCLGVISLLAVAGAASRNRELVLVPTSGKPLTISSAGITREYLEFVTRDTALMLLNRSPEALDYWMEQILELADPASHGLLKAELLKIVEEQRGSDVAQAFVIHSLQVDPKNLSSTVSGTLKTFVGSQVIASEERAFAFTWKYAGLRLSLTGFSQISDEEKDVYQ